MLKKSHSQLVLLILGLVSAFTGTPCSLADNTDWPTFLGPTRNGVSTETNLLTAWPEEGPPVLWERPIGTGYGAPVVADNKLVLFHRVDDHEIVECVDARDGTQTLWSYRYPTAYIDDYGSNNGPRSSPTIDGDRVYTFGAEGVLTCLDFQNGELQWQRKVNAEFNVPKGFFGAGTAPVIDDEILVLNVGGPDGAGVVAFDKSTGSVLWKTSNHHASYSTPTIATINGEELAIFHTGDGLLTVETKSGKVRHEYPFRSSMQASAIAATPIVIGNRVFLSGSYEIGAVLLELTKDSVDVVWKDRDTMQNHWATSIVHEGFLYGVTGRHEQGSKLRCIEFATGKIKWTAKGGLSRASFIQVGAHFLAIDERGTLAIIEVNPEEYVVVAEDKVLRHYVRTPPVLAGGLVYVRSEKQLKCIDLRKANNK